MIEVDCVSDIYQHAYDTKILHEINPAAGKEELHGGITKLYE